MDKKRVHELASELYITLTPEDETTFLASFDLFLKRAEFLNLSGIDDVEPLIFPYHRETTFLREDEVSKTPSREEILKNSKNTKGEYISIPKVVK